MPDPASPAGFVMNHARRRAQEDRQLASQYPAGPAPAPPPEPPKVAPPPTDGVREVVTYTTSGAKLVTLVGVEPRTDLHRPEAKRDRRQGLYPSNATRRCRHLL